MNKIKKGFTLIELLVVISIIGVLATLALASVGGAQKQARDSQRRSDLNQYRTALNSYAASNSGKFPTNATVVDLTSICGSSSPLESYMSSCPEDPKNTEASPEYTYQYLSSVAPTYKYIIYTHVETSESYYYLCSTGTNGVYDDASVPALATCPD